MNIIHPHIKVLLCTPYNQCPTFVQGGVVVWGANIVNYYKSLGNTDVELIPVSFDRQTYSESHNSKIGAFFNGIKELWRPAWSTIKLLKEGDINAVHICTNTGITMLKDLLIITAAKHYGAKAYTHYHCGTIPSVLQPNNKFHELFLRCLSKVTKGITMDLRSYNALKDYGIKNVVNLPNPLSFSIINQVAEKKQTVKKVPGRIAFVGHVLRSKGIFELIESCCKIGIPDLHIIGKVLPADKQEINALLSKYNTDGSWITWTGEIPHEKVIEELLAAEIFAFPSYTEGFPNVILEAMACGCAIVTTTVGAIPEMLDVTGEACGICVEPENTEAFYEALQSVYGNATLIKEYSSKAVARVNSQYTVDKVWEQMVKIWKS